jgi:flagellar protein FlgJ
MTSLQTSLTNLKSSVPQSLSQVGLRTTVEASSSRSTRDASREMEATFLSLLIKQMRETLDPEEGLFPGDRGDVQGGLFDLFISKHLADAGGIGLTEYVESHLTKLPAQAETSDAPSRTVPTASPGGSLPGLPGS